MRIAVVLVASFAAYVALALRLAALAGLEGPPGRAFATSFTASIFGLGMNNLLPARLGEIAKIFYLQGRCRRDTGWLLGAVFWERFADVHALLVLAGLTLLLIGEGRGVAPLGVAIGFGWGALIGLRRYRAWCERALARVAHETTRVFLTALLGYLAAGLGRRTALAVLQWTALLWLVYGLHVYLVAIWVADLPLATHQVLVVFLLVALGMVVPISPGGLGIYEAIFVAVLGWYGIPAEAALATALTAHMLQYVPTTALAAVILARADIPLQALRAARR